jgi:hypothetical protein
MSPARRESGADGSKSNRGNGLCVSGTVLSTNARRAWVRLRNSAGCPAINSVPARNARPWGVSYNG